MQEIRGKQEGRIGASGRHPLADRQGVDDILAALPPDNAFKALDEIAGWLESLEAAADFPVASLYEVLVRFDDAAQAPLARLARDYLQAPRLNRSDEKRLWSISTGVWLLLARLYERCAAHPAALSRAALPVLFTRLIAALAAHVQWTRFHYVPPSGELWRRLGRIVLQAEASACLNQAVTYREGASSPAREFHQLFVAQAVPMDALLPPEIELAGQLVAHVLPEVVFTPRADSDSAFALDLQGNQPPQRLQRLSSVTAPGWRFFNPGPAHARLMALLVRQTQGEDLSRALGLAENVTPRMRGVVLRHLVRHLAPQAPQRRHDRHRVKHRVSVLNGLVNAFVACSGEFGSRPAGLPMESWVVDNVSQGGFGARVPPLPVDWLRIGALVALQPEGGQNWLLGIVRRFRRTSEQEEASVGIQTIGRQVESVEVRVRSASSYGGQGAFPALFILDALTTTGERLLILPPSRFNAGESLEFIRAGQRHVLEPVALAQQTADYDLGRYRLSVEA